MCAWTCARMYACMRGCLCACIHGCLCACMRACLCACMRACLCACLNFYFYDTSCMCVFVCLVLSERRRMYSSKMDGRVGDGWMNGRWIEKRGMDG